MMNRNNRVPSLLAALLCATATPIFATTSTVITPEPSTFLMMGAGLAAAVLYARKKRK